MFIHAVLFWLREDLTPAEKAQFLDGANSLLSIESVEHGYLGAPASTDRPVIDRSYSYMLIVIFADEAAHDRYQVDPAHDKFRDECAPLWTKVLIYDSVSA